MRTRDALLAEIENFLDQSGMEAWRFGHEVIGDHTLVKRLRAGRDVNTGTADAIRAYLDSKRGAPRPRPTSGGDDLAA